MEKSRRKRPRGESARSALIEAAVAVVERDGVAAATTRRIAEEAGLPLGTVHYWFADKDDLIQAVIHALLAEMRENLSRHGSGTDTGGRLLDTFAALTSMAPSRQLAYFELTTYALRNAPHRALARDQYAAYRDTARAGLKPWERYADESLPGGSPALATLLVAVFDGLTLATLADPSEKSTRDALALFSHLLTTAGIGGDPGDAEDGGGDPGDAGDGVEGTGGTRPAPA
ncbi:TetR/AcrR family transcriptional regulator [Streptomyces sp. GC420]|uniref:TetR/AcrR family transcriptional regulator n=1 Tax=Streptomyces sp. GC420 TaxID=2697568 RepID=UPI0014151EEF|nr:TetR family transcriptional regulator [Streptomyces sp. GC420]NBM17436.1 TetR family transcriptional regulator [Streptomyces sp. GC420]